MDRLDPIEPTEKDAPLRYDIRLLGRILGDTVRAQEGDAGVRAGRAHPPHRRAVPPQCRRGGAPGTADDHERPADRPRAQHHPRLRLFLAPRQHRRGPAPHPPHARLRQGRGAAAAGHHGLCAGPRPPGAGCHARAAAGLLRPCAVQPGPDGASDGDPPQELDRPRDGDRPPARRARPDRVHAGGARRQPPGAAPQRAHPVADQPGARHAPARHRRGRQRPVLLRLHLPARAAAVLCRSRATCSAPPTRRGRRSRFRRSCAWEAGSAATATAIPSSPPR